MDEIIDQVFGDADSAHRQHLLSESYAEHQALGEFYPAARAAVDELVESMIALEIPMASPPDGAPLINLESAYVNLVEMRERVCQQDATLLTLFDNLTSVYTKAIYKLRRFAE